MRIYFFYVFFHHVTNKYKSRNNSYFKKWTENTFDPFYYIWSCAFNCYSVSGYGERVDFISKGKCKYKAFESKILFFKVFGFYFLLET